jgi:hypothetical protein
MNQSSERKCTVSAIRKMLILGACLSALLTATRSEAQTSDPQDGITINSVTATPSVLFPPNHKLIPVTVSVNATGCLVSCIILGVAANVPIQDNFQNPKNPDFIRTGELTVLLRATRSGNDKAGRIYQIFILCGDCNGNLARTSVFVTVPHDNGKGK